MAFSDLLAMERHLEEKKREQEKPSEKHRTFIPVIRDPIIKISRVDFSREEQIMTLVFATIGALYTKDYYEEDLKDVLSYFELRTQEAYHRIMMRPIADDVHLLDARDAIKQINEVLEKVNARGIQKIRIVSLGPSRPNFFYFAVEYLIEHWRAVNDEKNVQYVTSGDNAQKGQLEFFKSLVTKRSCTDVEYLNVRDYYPFGEYKVLSQKLAK